MPSPKQRHKTMVTAATIFSFYLVASTAAHGQEDTTKGQPVAPETVTDKPTGFGGYVMLGGILSPDYQGSSHYKFGPLAAGKLTYDTYYVEIKGPEARINLSPIDGLEFGPVMGLRSGRSDVSNNHVDAMRDIDGSFEMGGFIRASRDDVFMQQDQVAFGVEALTDVTESSQGTTISFGPSYEFSPFQRLRLGFDLSATYASSGYQSTYFGIDSGDARRSGLPTYKAGAGMKDVGLSITANYQLSDHWGLIGVAKYTRLVGDAADSPIVKDEGSRSQFMLGTGVVFRF